MNYSLITGATGYLGKAFAFELATHGENLILTGRSEEKLSQLSGELLEVNGNIDIKIFPCDLTDETERENFYKSIEGLAISRLVNVAGADIQKPLEEYDEKKLVFQSRICFESAVSTCNFAIKHRAESLKIINISSVSGIYPMPYFAIYSATKSALTQFSIALNEEMKGKNVTVTAVLPGAFYSRPDVNEYIKTQGAWGRLATKTPQFVAKKSLYYSEKGRVKVIVGFANKFMNFATKIIPLKLKLKFISKKWSQTRKDAF